VEVLEREEHVGGVVLGIGSIVLTAILTNIGTFYVTRYTLTQSAKNESAARQEELDRHARYLAIRVVCKLDPFVSGCCHVVLDEGAEDQEGVTFPRVEDPVLSFPEDVDWKTIRPDLMYRILGFPNEMDAAEQSIDFVRDQVAGPPDYEEYFEERTIQYGKLGLAALALADEIRETFAIPQREKHANWDPLKTLEKAVAEAKKQREKSAGQQAELMEAGAKPGEAGQKQ
jgi:hypothetical protein